MKPIIMNNAIVALVSAYAEATAEQEQSIAQLSEALRSSAAQQSKRVELLLTAVDAVLALQDGASNDDHDRAFDQLEAARGAFR